VFYARSGEAHVAYQVTGARPVDLVLTPGCISHLDLQEIRPGLPALRHAVPLSDWQQFASSSRADVRLPPVSPDAIAQIQYTSGTTGLPKGVLIRHRALTNSARLWAHSLGARPGDCWLNPNPLLHVSGSGFMRSRT